MKQDCLLFEIKILEKNILRLFLQNVNHTFQNKEFFPTPTQVQIVEYILKHPNEDVYQKDLEKVLHLRRATVSGVLGTMEKNHLIERIVDGEDLRVKRIIMHPKTKEAFLSHFEKIREIENLLVQGITEEELNLFWMVLQKMNANLKINQKEDFKCSN